MHPQRAIVREFLARHIRGHQLQDSDDIFALGFVNSLFAMQLVTFVESQFAITIDNEDLDIENFRSVDAVAAFVARKAAPAAPEPGA